MPTLQDTHIERLAESCVHGMGDIFWDYEESRDGKLDFTEPQSVAIAAVAATLTAFAQDLESSASDTQALRLEYRRLIRAKTKASDAAVVAAFVRSGRMTEQDARALLQLARRHGAGGLRKALALAEALNIEDGQSGR